MPGSRIASFASTPRPDVAPSVTVDGRAVQVSEVETALLDIVLPDDNLFGLPEGTEGPVGRPWMGGVA
jgi:hypothetical protein